MSHHYRVCCTLSAFNILPGSFNMSVTDFPNSNGFQPKTGLLNTLVIDPGMIGRLVTLAT